MKTYLLDLPAAAAAPGPRASSPEGPAPDAGGGLAASLRSVALAVALSVGLCVLYASWDASDVRRPAEGTGLAPLPPSAGPAMARAVTPAPLAARPTPPVPVPEPRGVVTESRGRYVVDLVSAAPEAAIATLARATRATVSGDRIFEGSGLRLTRSLAAPSAREAWQSVFGDVANFAVACNGAACDVRFVSLIAPASTTAGPAGAPIRLVEQLVQGVAKPPPTAAPVVPQPVQAAQAAPPVPPAPQSDDSNATEN